VAQELARAGAAHAGGEDDEKRSRRRVDHPDAADTSDEDEDGEGEPAAEDRDQEGGGD